LPVYVIHQVKIVLILTYKKNSQMQYLLMPHTFIGMSTKQKYRQYTFESPKFETNNKITDVRITPREESFKRY